ncbi:DUF3016 domain-containing protein [Bradyrhizobium sp. LMTR 3]|uniref:DUF3016 domain-containing protein n=1 Tax=Bradyrhizobium sp. LMTR 3 TaxID=189873 RepID=UPI000810A8A8|nr:DUF3016 domain-containing protein [Bradyrhizobium sp. LMTR 3]OCK54948.1 hypothetical protein LMTR3_09175 [Bradyrhizobium sp. LMTR 3]
MVRKSLFAATLVIWRNIGDATITAFRAYFEKLGRRLGQNLTIDVLNIDLAGHYEPWRRNVSDVRIMRDVTPPSFKLRYVLTERGKARQGGEDTLTDINYQMNASVRFSSDRYACEQALLDDWFRRTFANRSHHQRRVF